MDEYIFAILALNEAESLCGVKPLHSTCFFHLFSLLESTACRIDQGWSRGQIEVFPVWIKGHEAFRTFPAYHAEVGNVQEIEIPPATRRVAANLVPCRS